MLIDNNIIIIYTWMGHTMYLSVFELVTKWLHVIEMWFITNCDK